MNIFKKFTIFFFILLLLTGCVVNQPKPISLTKKEMMRACLVQVQKSDGINIEEAMLLARCELAFRDITREYNYIHPDILPSNGKNWIVRFNHKNKTMQDSIQRRYLVVIIDKSNGEARCEDKRGDL